MNNCSSSKHTSDDDSNFSGEIPASKFSILPFAAPPFNFVHSTPFFRHRLSLNPNSRLLADASNAAREAQRSVIVNVDKCMKMLHKFMFQNGVLDKIICFSSYVQSCCQIPNGHCLKLDMPSNQKFAAILPGGDSVAGVVVANGILNFLSIYNTLLVIRIVLTWFPNAPTAVVSPLSTLCDPYLNIFRGIIPPLGGTLDLSPILAFLVLNAFTSTAAALPAELPPMEVNSAGVPSHITATQKKWMRRIAANKSARSNSKI